MKYKQWSTRISINASIRSCVSESEAISNPCIQWLKLAWELYICSSISYQYFVYNSARPLSEASWCTTFHFCTPFKNCTWGACCIFNVLKKLLEKRDIWISKLKGMINQLSLPLFIIWDSINCVKISHDAHIIFDLLHKFIS